jgi:hypothetical protein
LRFCLLLDAHRQGSTLAALEQNYRTYQALAAAGAVPAPSAGGQASAGKGGIERLGQDAGAEAMDVSDDDMDDAGGDGMAVDGAGQAAGGKQGKGKVRVTWRSSLCRNQTRLASAQLWPNICSIWRTTCLP